MRIIIVTIIFSLMGLAIQAQSNLTNSRNYIKKETILKPNKTTPEQVEALDHQDKAVTIEYFDGLGRPEQVIQYKGGAKIKGVIKDIVTPIIYDNYGRKAKEFLPFANTTNNGAFEPDAISRQSDFMTIKYGSEDGQAAFSNTQFEASPLNRVMAKGAPGATWQPNQHPVRFDYGTNDSYDVLLFCVKNNQLENIVGESKNGHYYYKANELYKTVTKDENWTNGNLHTTEDFKDKLGQVVLKRSYVKVDNVVTPVETYYVYDDYGLLRYVIPPKAVYNLLHPGADYSTDASAKWITADESLSAIENGVNTYLVDNNGSLTLKNGFTFSASNNNSLSISTVSLSDDLMYSYKYDDRKRMIEKKIPGAAPVYMVYDERDRLVATQDGKMRDNGEWLFTKYDAFNRPILTGILSGNKSRTYIETELAKKKADGNYFYSFFESAGNDVHTYSNNSFPNVSEENAYLTVTYYDNYNWMGNANVPDYFNQLYNAFSCPENTARNLTAPSFWSGVKGQVTGTKTIVLGSGNWLNQTNFYDDRYRLICSVSDNNVGGEDILINEYDFSGKVLASNQKHSSHIHAYDYTCVIREEHNYDHAGRLLNTQRYMTGAPLITLVENTYNELGELINKNVSNAQQMSYRYNIRGWLTHINDVAKYEKNKDFAMQLHYNEGLSALGGDAQYNGNISGVQWKTFGTKETGTPNGRQGYGYKYDALNRLSSASYGAGDNLTQSFDDYSIKGIKYDVNGNILKLNRDQRFLTSSGQKQGAIDQLEYLYMGNQLQRVSDFAPETIYTATDNKVRKQSDRGFLDGNKTGQDYWYDSNGNLERDLNKGLQQVHYNHLNLPAELLGSDGKRISYIYDANGQKLSKVSSSGQRTMYCANFIYKGNSIDRILTSEGFYVVNGQYNAGEYYFNVNDHLGNVRLVVNQDGLPVDQTDYYPFGLNMNASLNMGGVNNPFKYNGKELQDDAIGNGSLDWYDYGARFYDPAIARFFTHDRFSEKYYPLTPYQYGANNPIYFIDVNGDSLSVTGVQTAIDKYTAIVDAGLGGYYTTQVDDNGVVTLESTGKEGEMTKEQKAFYEVMSDVIDPSKGNVTIGLVESDERVFVGSFKLEAIDVDDVSKFPVTGPATASGAMAHEVAEQASKQLDGNGYAIAHIMHGLKAEDKANNSFRGSKLSSTKVTQNAKGQMSGNVDVRYSKGGTSSTVSIHITNNNVTKVEVK